MSILNAHLSRPLEGGPSFSVHNRLFRLTWRVAWLCLGAWTPPILHPWRRWLLVAFGARLAPSARVRASARIWYPPHLSMEEHSLIGPGVQCYNIAPIHVGRRTVVSQHAHLCTGSHDLSDQHFQLIARRITLEANVWIAAGAFVGPGVIAREGAVLAAHGATFTDLAAWTVYRGNPAQVIKKRAFTLGLAKESHAGPGAGNFLPPTNL